MNIQEQEWFFSVYPHFTFQHGKSPHLRRLKHTSVPCNLVSFGIYSHPLWSTFSPRLWDQGGRAQWIFSNIALHSNISFSLALYSWGKRRFCAVAKLRLLQRGWKVHKHCNEFGWVENFPRVKESGSKISQSSIRCHLRWTENCDSFWFVTS